MPFLTAARASSFVAVLVAAWSFNGRWGTDPGIPAGPPGQWERQVVGALLLLIVTLVALIAARGGLSRVARGVAVAASLGALALAFSLHLKANAAHGFPDLVHGTGWPWLMAGAGLGVGAAAIALFDRSATAAAGKAPAAGKGGKRKRR
jgi:hypothetical protein